MAGGSVQVLDPAGNFVAFAATDDAGAFSFPALLASTYKVLFNTPDFSRTQYAHGKTSLDEADPVVVVGGADTVLDEQLLATGTVVIRAKDATDGATVTGFCLLGLDACDNGTGVITLTDVPPGQQIYEVDPQSGRYFNEGVTVIVPSGGTVSVTVSLRRAASITTRLVDRRTGAPVVGGCVEPIPVGDLNPVGVQTPFCSDATGTVTVGPIDPGSLHLFIRFDDGQHGMMWVNPSGGGTGRSELARVVKATAGAVTSVPTVKVDRAGRIAGRITDTAGAPLENARALLNPFNPIREAGFGSSTDADGRYVFEGLGPYDWPIYFWHFQHAPQWSGGVANRLLATPVTVREGRTSTANARLSRGTTVTGTLIANDGGPVVDGFVVAVNLVTGDVMGSSPVTDGHYTLYATGPQAVQLKAPVFGPSTVYYGQTNQPVLISGHGTLTINIPVSAQS